jgi:hypothetical protein
VIKILYVATLASDGYDRSFRFLDAFVRLCQEFNTSGSTVQVFLRATTTLDAVDPVIEIPGEQVLADELRSHAVVTIAYMPPLPEFSADDPDRTEWVQAQVARVDFAVLGQTTALAKSMSPLNTWIATECQRVGKNVYVLTGAGEFHVPSTLMT